MTDPVLRPMMELAGGPGAALIRFLLGALPYVLAMAVSCGGFFGLRHHYIGVGVAREKARQDRQAVTTMADMIAAHKALIGEAQAASLAMQAAVAQRRQADEASTRSLKNALAKTASSRRDCLFDDDSLRQLDEARARAAAAAAGGLPRRPAPAAGAFGQHGG